MKLGKNFFNRSADVVAKDLLGKILVRKICEKEFRGKIVETEAYFGKEDPASRASKGKSPTFEIMWDEAGKILVYYVHKYIMFCIVTGKKDKPEAILIRALEPVDCDLRFSGPGLLSDSLNISKNFQGKNIFDLDELWIENSEEVPRLVETTRIGVNEENPLHLRFYIKGNNFISRK